MKRFLFVVALLGAGVVVARKAKLHQRVMAHCEGMFEQMPDTFPPKRMMLGIEKIRADTTRILTLLEGRSDEEDSGPARSSSEPSHHAA
jgi:hypothetical protein